MGWRPAPVRVLGCLIFLALLSGGTTGCDSTGLREANGELIIRPNPIRFGAVSLGREVSLSLELRNRGVAPLSILSIEGDGDLPSVFQIPKAPSKPIPSGGAVELEVRFAPEDVEKYQGRLTIRTSSGKEPRLVVPIEGEGREPSLACTSRLEFGKVPYNTEKVLSIACVNGGRVAAELHLRGLHGDDPDFYALGENLEGDTVLVPVGHTQLVDVRFTAKHLGTARATARLHVVGMEDPDVEVALVGEGFASDLVAVPSCIHFGPVSPGLSAERIAIVANGGDHTVRFDGPSIIDGSGVFSIVDTTVDGVEGKLDVLKPDQMAEITVAFRPKSMGRFNGALRLRNDDPVNSHMEVCLTGIGGGADIRVNPEELDFGRLGLGMQVTLPLSVSNVGTADGGPLEIKRVTVSDATNFSVKMPKKTMLAAGDPPVPIEVTFHPSREGSFSATLTISSNDGDQPDFTVPVSGTGLQLPPCSYSLRPEELRFEAMAVGSVSTLVSALENTGSDECIIASLRLSKGSSSQFSLPGQMAGAFSVMPGERVDIPVQFDAERAGTFTGAVVFDVSGPGAPKGQLPLWAEAFKGCLEAEPASLDFGERRLSCPAVGRSVRLTNRCTSTVQITDAALGPGSQQSGEIGVPTVSLPFSLAPAASRTLSFSYKPQDDGDDAALYQIQSSVHPLGIAIHGKGTSQDERTDRFQQRSRTPVDILFVIDNSGSMADKQKAVATGCSLFMQYALAQGIDFHIGVTTTGLTPSTGSWSPCPGGVSGGEAGRLFPLDGTRPRWVDSTMPNAAGVFAQNVQVGICHWLEQGLEASYLALSSPLVDHSNDPATPLPNDGNLGFYRPEARLSVVLISDEEDQSPRPTSFYSSFFRGLKGPGQEDRVSVNAVVGKGCGSKAEEGRRYMEVVKATNGLSEPICTEDWGVSLARLAEQSFGYQLIFPLSGVPEGSVKVRVDGKEAKKGWSYDEDTNAVIFEQAHAPAPGVAIEVTYIPSC